MLFEGILCEQVFFFLIMCLLLKHHFSHHFPFSFLSLETNQVQLLARLQDLESPRIQFISIVTSSLDEGIKHSTPTLSAPGLKLYIYITERYITLIISTN